MLFRSRRGGRVATGMTERKQRLAGEEMAPQFREERFGGEPAQFYRPEDLPERVPPAAAAPEKKEKKTTSDLEKLFLYELMANMRGGDIGQAPAVVAGGGRREFPTMMRQFAPWEREKPYWWIR